MKKNKSKIFISIKVKLILLLGFLSIIIFSFSIGLTEYMLYRDFGSFNTKYLMNLFYNYLNEINKILESMMNNGLNIAKIGEEFYKNINNFSYQSLFNFFSNLLVSHLKNLPYAFGTGIWFEPYIFGNDIKWFGPYCSRVEEDKIEITMEYSSDKYNYISHNWYKVVFEDKYLEKKIIYKKIKNNVYLSPPYLDTYYNKIITFITLTVPIYSGKKIIGVTSTDWSLDTIEKILSKFYITRNSFCFFVDPFYKKILYHPDKSLIMVDIGKTQWGKYLDANYLIKDKVTIYNNIKIYDKLYDIYLSKTSLDYIFGFCINVNEANSFLINIRKRNMIIIFTSIILILFLVILIGNNLVQPIIYLTNTMKSITKSKFLYEPKLLERNDEIGILSYSFHEAYEAVKEYSFRLFNNKNFLETILNNIDNPIIVLDSNFIIQLLNKSAIDFIKKNFTNSFNEYHKYDYEKKESINIKIFSILPDLKKYEDDFINSIKKNNKIIFYDQTFNNMPKSIFNIFFIPLIFDQESNEILIIQDITEIREKDRIIRQAQKMDAIGNLASGFAHDFNNIIVGIIGTLSLMMEELKEKDKDKKFILEDLNFVQECAKKASDLVKNLLSLSRNPSIEKKEFNIVDSLNSIIKLCENSFPKNIKIITDIEAIDVLIYGDKNQIEQVILNILINAMHALTIMVDENNKPSHPKISVKLSVLMNDTSFMEKYPLANEKYYCQISISDNGVGMDSNTLNKIFDPFFTTKSKEHGTGLGLSVAYNIIKNHNGFIIVDSLPGIGSTFTIYLPLYSDSILKDIKNQNDNIMLGKGTILLIDDDCVVRKITKKMLEFIGYSVLEEQDPIKALTNYKQNYQKIDLIICDLSMPSMSGFETFNEIKKINFKARIVIYSGFTRTSYEDEIKRNNIRFFLKKPFTIQELSSIVYKAINEN